MPVTEGHSQRAVVIAIDAAEITDRAAFHAVFYRELGFTGFYGNNMDAWLDCMSYVHHPESGMISVTIKPGELAILQMSNVRIFRKNCRDLYENLIEGIGFVNSRLLEIGESPAWALMLID